MAETPKLLNQIVKLPLRAFIFSLEMFVQTAQGLQKLAYQGIDAMLGADVPPDVGASSDSSSFTNQDMPGGVTPTPDEAISGAGNSTAGHTVSMVNGTASEDAATKPKERVNMRDANLSDDMLKLVRFKILFVKREYEVAFPEEEDLVPDNMTGADFAAWKVAEFIQRLGHRPPEVRYPKRWLKKSYFNKYSLPKDWEQPDEVQAKPWKTSQDTARALGGEERAEDTAQTSYESEGTKKGEPYWLIGFPEEDKKYLRVFYEVLERYPREKLRYEERQLEILEKIAEGVKG
jgi:hypothetical protein